MRFRLLVVWLFFAVALPTFAVASAATATIPFKAVLGAPTHTPKVNAKWWYSVRATDLRGRPIRATITVEVIDPYGGVHPVQYDNTNKNIVNRPFAGVFRDYNQFPPESSGIKLVVRVTVRAKGAKIVRNYWVKAV